MAATGTKKGRVFISSLAVVMVAVIILGSICLPCLTSEPIYLPLTAPDGLHLLGTDNSGRDILALLIQSAAISLSIGLGSALCAVTIGASVGCTASYLRSPADDLLMRLADLALLIPALPLIIVMAAYLGPGVLQVSAVIALTAWPSTARLIYAHVLKLREELFVVNARSMGAGRIYLMVYHILPNCTELLLAKTVLTVASSMLAEAGVSFLGLGDSAHPSWGSMLHDAFSSAALINGYWWWYLPPVLCISSAVVLLNMAGYLLSDRELTSSSVRDAGVASRDSAASRDSSADADYDTRQKGTLLPLFSSTLPPLLSIRDLGIRFSGSTGLTRALVDQLNLNIHAGEKVAVIGATGSGKSLLLLSLLGLLPNGAEVSGSILIQGEDLATFSEAELRRHRGLFAAYVPQGAGHALNPLLSVGDQVGERMRSHMGFDRDRALKRAARTLAAVGFADPEELMRSYPHHLSGGMKQRVLLAMALSGNPSLILADEPTKGLDQSAIDEILTILKNLKLKTVVTVTHDLLFAQALCSRVVVIYAGLLVEDAPASSFFNKPLHPYSRALVEACPSRGMVVESLAQTVQTLLEGQGCPYLPNCLFALQQCKICPPLSLHQGHQVRCWCNDS